MHFKCGQVCPGRLPAGSRYHAGPVSVAPGTCLPGSAPLPILSALPQWLLPVTGELRDLFYFSMAKSVSPSLGHPSSPLPIFLSWVGYVLLVGSQNFFRCCTINFLSIVHVLNIFLSQISFNLVSRVKFCHVWAFYFYGVKSINLLFYGFCILCLVWEDPPRS